MMNRGEENSVSLPVDLIIVILSRLPAKSIARFYCLSKLWSSMLHRPYFTELFLTRSRARSRLLFAIGGNGEWNFYSAPQPQNPYKKSSLVVAADFHTKFVGNFCSYASGLVYFSDTFISTVPMVCNPNTGQYLRLPALSSYRKSTSFLGFDPIDKQFKVLAEAYPFCEQRDHHKILTLGTEKLWWMGENHCPGYSHYMGGGICINGVLYYFAAFENSCEIVCFDVWSEKFKVIHAKCLCEPTAQLINYKGKLGVICWNGGVELHMWVLEDVGKQEWSKYVYTLPEKNVVDLCNVFVVGITALGEIVFSKNYTSKQPFYVFYFNPEKNTFQRVEIQGLDENRSRVYAFVDHIEDLNVNDAKLFK